MFASRNYNEHTIYIYICIINIFGYINLRKYWVYIYAYKLIIVCIQNLKYINICIFICYIVQRVVCCSYCEYYL